MQDRGLLTLTKLLLWTTLFVGTLQGVQGETDIPRPSESECQPYIEKALKKLETGDTQSAEADQTEEDTTHLSTNDESEIIRDSHEINTDALQSAEETAEINDIVSTEDVEGSQLNEDDADSTSTEKHEIERRSIEEKDDCIEKQDAAETVDPTSGETAENHIQSEEEKTASIEISLEQEQEQEASKENISTDNNIASAEQIESSEHDKDSNIIITETSTEQEGTDVNSKEISAEQEELDLDSKTISAEEEIIKTEPEGQSVEESEQQSVEDQEQKSLETEENISVQPISVEENEHATTEQDSIETTDKNDSEKDDQTKEESIEEQQEEDIKETDSLETVEQQDNSDQIKEEDETDEKSTILSAHQISQESEEEHKSESKEASLEQDDKSKRVDKVDSQEYNEASLEDTAIKESTEEQSIENRASEKEISEQVSAEEEKVVSAEKIDSVESDKISQETVESIDDQVSLEVAEKQSEEKEVEESKEVAADSTKSEESIPVEDLTWEIEIPEDLRSREHIDEIFHLSDEGTKQDNSIKTTADKTLQELKRIYENAIKPLEVLYKYRDLSNRHFGDSEIFSKPLVVFMGPWSGGKSSIINYLLDNEYQQTSLRTGAEPSPAYFNLLSWGEKPEIQDGTQLAADWTFSGLQKFGQGLEERLRGLKLPSKLLEKINIVEIPGILEVRKQVSRMFPFNDACQWFIDRADIIFLVYDPSKLDVGPETEAILDQLKGREYQTRIILNKADQVKPEELMRVQGALIWNISPLMSSAQPPVMYSTSLWSRPYESGAPTRLLFAQERAFLNDLKSAIDKRIENKISSARRFAVRVRNHAKMVDCYLTTYYNHKSVFGNKKMVADQIIEHPQNYHIYEGLSTLTNISRYDLPDPDVYRDFFRLNPLYDFQQLSATCTYFRGCPINRLDVAIAYDLPELVGKYKKAVEFIQTTAETTTQS